MTLLPEPATESWTPSNEAERGAVQQQLEKLLATPLFNSSRRYPSFLRHVVARVLAGETDQLKERILGVEIFGRNADYDTNTDPIVRVTAAEIRKRIEHYYQDPKHSQEIRIYLPAGSYAPQFSWPGHSNGTPLLEHEAASPVHGVAGPQMVQVPVPHDPTPLAATRTWWRGWKLPVTLGLVIAIAAATLWNYSSPATLKQFWSPFIKSQEPVLFCLADQNQYSSIRLRDAADPQKEITLSDSMVAIIIDDVEPLVNVAGMLRTYGKTYRVLGESTTTLTDLRRGPAVYIGAFDNSWTLRLTAPLRFHFANNPTMAQLWIEDRANPTNRAWMLERSQQFNVGVYKDYAIVARLIDPDTDQYAVVAAGISRGGTVAAGEFLVDEHYMEEMASQVPGDWRHKNLEVVLESQVIQGKSGPPRIIAVHVW
jgi:hypothetical protein